ncbi:PD-(D/E)XK nuclease family transposase [Parabacteroides faecis]|uniref:PD-(D/E)XK nuclease family transposase n=1 Tax=Parabacteroides TaxID=375288 RepID=UPI0026BF2C90|nr:PD-(D/E)XK nuclease family transposase [Parabacteroides faecis]
MNKFVNPFSDYGWKKIFGSEVSKDLIISFLNEVIQQEVIVDITFRKKADRNTSPTECCIMHHLLSNNNP